MSLVGSACGDPIEGTRLDGADAVHDADGATETGGDGTAGPPVWGAALPAPGAEATLACLERWIGRDTEGSMTTAQRYGTPVVEIHEVTRAMSTFTLGFSWHDVWHDLTGEVTPDGPEAGLVRLQLPPAQDGSLGIEALSLVARFDGPCTALVGVATARTAPGIGVFVVTLAPDEAGHRALLDERTFDFDGETAWLTSHVVGAAFELDVPSLDDEPLALAWDGRGLSGYTLAAPIDGDPARASFELTPDGRGAHFEVELAAFADVVASDFAASFTRCLVEPNGTELVGWLPRDGAPREVVAHAEREGDALVLVVRDVATGVVTRDAGVFGDADLVAAGYATFVRFGAQALAVAHDCSAAWGMTRDGRWRDGFLFRRPSSSP